MARNRTRGLVSCFRSHPPAPDGPWVIQHTINSESENPVDGLAFFSPFPTNDTTPRPYKTDFRLESKHEGDNWDLGDSRCTSENVEPRTGSLVESRAVKAPIRIESGQMTKALIVALDPSLVNGLQYSQCLKAQSVILVRSFRLSTEY